MTKSTNNIAMVASLQRIGLSISGAKQVLAAQAVTNQIVRDLLAKLAGHVASGGTVKT